MNSFKPFTTLTCVAFAYVCVLQQSLVEGAGPHVAVEVPRLQKAADVCRAKSGVSDAVFEAAMNNKMDANDRNLQCYTKCVFNEMKTMDENGNMSLETFVAELSKDNKVDYADSFLSCQTEVDDKDLCVKGMKLYQCFQKKSGSKFYFV